MITWKTNPLPRALLVVLAMIRVPLTPYRPVLQLYKVILPPWKTMLHPLPLPVNQKTLLWIVKWLTCLHLLLKLRLSLQQWLQILIRQCLTLRPSWHLQSLRTTNIWKPTITIFKMTTSDFLETTSSLEQETLLWIKSITISKSKRSDMIVRLKISRKELTN